MVSGKIGFLDSVAVTFNLLKNKQTNKTQKPISAKCNKAKYKMRYANIPVIHSAGSVATTGCALAKKGPPTRLHQFIVQFEIYFWIQSNNFGATPLGMSQHVLEGQKSLATLVAIRFLGQILIRRMEAHLPKTDSMSALLCSQLCV